jgi:hypothetical protein
LQNYQRLFWVNQERSDKMNSVYNSVGYHSTKSGGGSDDSDILLDAVEAYKVGNMTESDQVSGLLIQQSLMFFPCRDVQSTMILTIVT